jgi:hypothetical protein
MEANPPPGMWAATGSTASKAPSLADIRRGSFGSDGWNENTQRKRASTRTSQEERAKPSRKTSTGTVVTPLEGGSEPFPAVTEEDMRERPSGDHVRSVPGDETHYKQSDTGVQLRQSNSTTDKTTASATQQQSQVRTDVAVAELRLMINPVCERLYTTTEASLEALFCHWSERFLEVVSDTSGLPHNTLRIECRSMGWYAFPTALQRGAGHVHSHLRRHQLPAQDMGRDRFADSKRSFLRYWIWSCSLAIPGFVLVGLVEDRWLITQGDRNSAPGWHSPRMVPFAWLRSIARACRRKARRPRGSSRANSSKQNTRPATNRNPCTSYQELEDGFRSLVQRLEHLLPDCPLLLHVSLQPHRKTVLGDGHIRGPWLHSCWCWWHHDVARRQEHQEG